MRNASHPLSVVLVLSAACLAAACSSHPAGGGGTAATSGGTGTGGAGGTAATGGTGATGGTPTVPTGYYLILHEENTDTLETNLDPTPPSGPAPFELVDDVIEVRSDVIDNAANGRPHPNYPLTTIPQSLDPVRAALFVEHRVSFTGQGRDFSFARYLIVDSLPASVTMPRYDAEAERIDLELLDNVFVLMTVQYPPGQLDIVDEADTLRVNAIALTDGGAPVVVGSESHSLQVTTEEVTPLPEDFVGTSDVGSRIYVLDRGESTFNTQLSAELRGRFDVVAR